MTVRKQDLVRITKAARADRDRIKEDATVAYYARLGTALEASFLSAQAGRAAHPLSIPADMGTWTPHAAALFAETDTLWKRISTAAVTTRDLVEAALTERELAIFDGRGPSGSEAEAAAGGPLAVALVEDDLASGVATAASAVYATLGHARLETDAMKARDAMRAMLDEALSLLRRVEGGGAPFAAAPAAEFAVTAAVAGSEIAAAAAAGGGVGEATGAVDGVDNSGAPRDADAAAAAAVDGLSSAAPQSSSVPGDDFVSSAAAAAAPAGNASLSSVLPGAAAAVPQPSGAAIRAFVDLVLQNAQLQLVLLDALTPVVAVGGV